MVTRSQARRSGYTLLEIILVIALIVAFAAISAPAINSMYRSVQLDAGVDVLKSALVEARLNAIEHGRPYRVAILHGDWNVRVAPESPEFWDGSGTRTFASAQQGDDPPFVREAEAPEGIRIHPMKEDGTIVRGNAAQEIESKEIPPDQWQTLAVFFPDGTAHKNVKVMLTYENLAPRLLTLRGLTGGVSTRDATEEERAQLPSEDNR